ncbi:hypothetical protein MMC26_000998 [Xylographa opegraphella]|nr:hypothetical protein [Xylographa opegraphella]
MHILVTNDDGPPSQQSSPYVHSLVKTLQDAGHTVSVILPHVQRSWIGKAHFVGQLTKPTYFRPGTLHEDDGTTHERPLPEGAMEEEWVLVDGTPGTCAQLGLYHFFQERGPIDLVVSGPNYGRNSTSLFSLSSGTIGGAMEAATCRKKAIALSYAFYSRDHDPVLIAGASRQSVRIVEHLYNNWGEDVDLYSINVPMIQGVEDNKVMYTNVLQNYWSSGSPFQEVEADEEEKNPDEQEREIRQQQHDAAGKTSSSGHKHKYFKWAPKFTDIHKSIEENPPGNDGWAIKEGYTSVTPLKANFMHASSNIKGELKLPKPIPHPKPHPTIHALIDYEGPYVQPLILSALQTHLPASSYNLIASVSDLPTATSLVLLITSYESLPFTHIHAHPTSAFANAYIIRKALIRKHYLAFTLDSYLTKYPSSPLKQHIPASVSFELDYAEFLDDAILEAFELHESFARNDGKEPVAREWWILKPSMSDRGQGIRLFSTESELQAIFEEWETENSEEGSEGDTEMEDEGIAAVRSGMTSLAITESHPPETDISSASKEQARSAPYATSKTPGNGIITSQLRHFVAQPYIAPLLFPELGKRKFHIRTYVAAVGALKVYVYREMLALFTAIPYIKPGAASTDPDNNGGEGRWASENNRTGGQADDESEAEKDSPFDMRAHLTNTCLQDGTREGSVLRFWDLPATLPPSVTPPASSSCAPAPPSTDWRAHVFSTICACTASLFEAASTQPTTFQPLPNAFEVFGMDWMVDERGAVWLLEVNAFPDFGQTGEGLRDVVKGLWEGVVGVAVGDFFGVGERGGGGGDQEKVGDERWGLRLVLDLDMGRG